MAFDLASLLGSAIVGGLSGVAFASWKVGQEEAARHRVQARRQVRAAVGEQLTAVIGYRSGFGDGRISQNSKWVEDYTWASKVLLAADGLGPLRRRLIRKRLERLVGPIAAELAEVRPAQTTDTDVDAVIGAMLEVHRSGKYHPKGPPKGLLNVALRQDRDSKDVTKLVRELKLLAKAR
ncbi:hypothetical protein ACQPYE_08490 [Actinosynnema sp. CA-299493]